DLAVSYAMGMPSWVVLDDPKYDIWLTHTPRGEGRAYSGTAITMYTHVGTHVCSLNHLGRNGLFWNGWTEETHLGSRNWRGGGKHPPDRPPRGPSPRAPPEGGERPSSPDPPPPPA